MSSDVNTIRKPRGREYRWGFVTEIEDERVPTGYWATGTSVVLFHAV